jgi:hypothetical protein
MDRGYDSEVVHELNQDTLNTTSLIPSETGNVIESPDSSEDDSLPHSLRRRIIERKIVFHKISYGNPENFVTFSYRISAKYIKISIFWKKILQTRYIPTKNLDKRGNSGKTCDKKSDPISLFMAFSL